MRYPYVQNPHVFNHKVQKMLPGYPMMHHKTVVRPLNYGMNDAVKTVAGASVAMIGIGTIGAIGIGTMGMLHP